MAFSRISVENVLENVLEDEQSLDDSDSEDGKDIYGYLGAFVVPRVELEGESRHLSVRINGGNDETSSCDGEFDEPSLMECDNDSWANVMLAGVQALKTKYEMLKSEMNLKMKHQLK